VTEVKSRRDVANDEFKVVEMGLEAKGNESGSKDAARKLTRGV